MSLLRRCPRMWYALRHGEAYMAAGTPHHSVAGDTGVLFRTIPPVCPDKLRRNTNLPDRTSFFNSLELLPPESSPILKLPPSLSTLPKTTSTSLLDTLPSSRGGPSALRGYRTASRPAYSETPLPGPSHALEIVHSPPSNIRPHGLLTQLTARVVRRPEISYDIPSPRTTVSVAHPSPLSALPIPTHPLRTARIPCFLLFLVSLHLDMLSFSLRFRLPFRFLTMFASARSLSPTHDLHIPVPTCAASLYTLRTS